MYSTYSKQKVLDVRELESKVVVIMEDIETKERTRFVYGAQDSEYDDCVELVKGG